MNGRGLYVVGVACSKWAWPVVNGHACVVGVACGGGGAEPQFRATHTRCGVGCGAGEMQPPPRKVRAGSGCSKGGTGTCVWGLQRGWGWAWAWE